MLQTTWLRLIWPSQTKHSPILCQHFPAVISVWLLQAEDYMKAQKEQTNKLYQHHKIHTVLGKACLCTATLLYCSLSCPWVERTTIIPWNSAVTSYYRWIRCHCQKELFSQTAEQKQCCRGIITVVDANRPNGFPGTAPASQSSLHFSSEIPPGISSRLQLRIHISSSA